MLPLGRCLASIFGLGIAGYLLALAVAASTVSAQATPGASADIRDRLSRFVGTAGFLEDQGGVHITGVLRNLPPGPHGLHIDNVAKCLSPGFLSAGTIFNPTGKKHGLRNPGGPQLGDLPSLVVSPEGIANLDVVASGATLSGGPTSLLGGSGTALVIHVADDDQVSDPEGNAGDRLACGVILPTDPVAASATAQARASTSTAVAPVGAVAAQPAGRAAVVGQQTVPVQPSVATQRGGADVVGTLGSPLSVAVLGAILVAAGLLLRRQMHSR
jgi:Cu-Zn family superoxide dismutase